MAKIMNEIKVKNIMDKFSNFTDGVRMIMLTQRSKEGGKVTNPDKVSRRKISMNRQEFQEILEEFIKIKEKSSLPLRIYSSINARDFEKGIREFKRQQLEADYYDEENKHRFYSDIKNRFLSSLMKPNSRKETRFLIDIDEIDDENWIRRILTFIGAKNLLEYKTKNGKHIITEPFNPSLALGIEVKKDALLLLDY